MAVYIMQSSKAGESRILNYLLNPQTLKYTQPYLDLRQCLKQNSNVTFFIHDQKIEETKTLPSLEQVFKISDDLHISEQHALRSACSVTSPEMQMHSWESASPRVFSKTTSTQMHLPIKTFLSQRVNYSFMSALYSYVQLYSF
jgi:hypothetical protein